jgi:hypothetical protein
MDITAEQVGGGALLQSVLDSYTRQGPVTVWLQPGTYTLPAPLRLGPEFNGITLQASGKGVVLQGPPTPGDEFIHGLITVREANSVTIRGIQLAAPQIRISPSERSFSGLHPRNGRLLRDFSRRLHVTTGISARGSAGLTVDDCTFDLPDPGRVNSFAAGIFATGAMGDLTIKGCTFRVGRAPAADNRGQPEPPYAARRQTVVFHNLATGERAEPPYQLAFGYLQVPTLESDGRTLTRPHSLDGAAIERCSFQGLTVPALVMARLGSLRVSRNTVRGAYGGFWLVSIADPRLAVIFDRIAIGQATSYQEILERFGGAALLDRLFVIATAIGHVMPATPGGGDGPEFGKIPTPDARLLGLARQAFTSFYLRDAGTEEELPREIEALFKDLEDAGLETGIRATGKTPAGHRGTGLHGRRPRLRLDLGACEIDAIVADSNCGAGVLVADFTAGTGSVLLHDNQIRGRFPSGETVFLGGVAETCVTGNIVANEAGHEHLRSSSLALHPGTIHPAAVITGNVFIAPPRLTRRENAPPPHDDWQLLNTVVHPTERATPSEPVQPTLWIVLTNTADAGESFDLHPGEMVIGREEGSEIQLEDQRVSHRHAILRVRDGDVTIEDMNSTNGTRVNDVDIGQETSIGPGDRIDVAGVELLVEEYQINAEWS